MGAAALTAFLGAESKFDLAANRLLDRLGEQGIIALNLPAERIQYARDAIAMELAEMWCAGIRVDVLSHVEIAVPLPRRDLVKQLLVP